MTFTVFFVADDWFGLLLTAIVLVSGLAYLTSPFDLVN